MMGRKLEEGDWAKVYCAAKQIPLVGWSNLSIDIIHGNLGVEHKMICRRSDQSIRTTCGTVIMHPAGTRAIRIPDEEDPTRAAQNVLKQYGQLLSARGRFVSILDRYNHSALSPSDAAVELMDTFDIERAAARRLLPPRPIPTARAYEARDPDMRTGWLLWQDSLREFLYFEEPMVAPKPSDYYAEWVDSGGGRRRKSRNLWVYHRRSKEKHFSITTEAGAKVQPYFRVPAPDDANLYYFIAQGEPLPGNMVRIWLTEVTAGFLKTLLGSLEPAVVSKAIAGTDPLAVGGTAADVFAALSVEVQLPATAYDQLKGKFPGVSDEHMMQQFLRALQRRT